MLNGRAQASIQNQMNPFKHKYHTTKCRYECKCCYKHQEIKKENDDVLGSLFCGDVTRELNWFMKFWTKSEYKQYVFEMNNWKDD